MNAELKRTLLQLAFPTAAILVGLAIARYRDYSLTQDLRLVLPSWQQAVLWLVGWVLWIAASELLSRRLGFPQPPRWEVQEPQILALRVFTLVIMAPIAEEFIFRGLLVHRLSETRLGPIGAILIAAGVFAVIHLQYRSEQLVLIFLDGVVLGLALYSSGSLVLPIMMHVIGNLYAVYQRLPESYGIA
jgi:membrane protease YdiL (CAAX protease family)